MRAALRRSLPLLLAILFAAAEAPAQQPGPLPNPALSPEQVVRVQLDALRDNNRPARDSGIALAFRFASPGNRAFTGPLPRFAALVRSPAYEVLLGHRSARIGPVQQRGARARVRVTVQGPDGSLADFQWELSRQRGGPCDGCWMTDGVVREEVRAA